MHFSRSPVSKGWCRGTFFSQFVGRILERAPPSLEALRVRLTGRGTDDVEEVERRLLVAEGELAAQPEFGRVVVNDRLEEALEQLTEIVTEGLG